MLRQIVIVAIAIAIVIIGAVHALPNANDAFAETRSYKSDIREDGSYSYSYDTSNGIAAAESGVGGYYASGSAAYYSPEGQLISLTYNADENGFQPQGEHLPTPPPVPAAILRALEYIRTHPNQETRQGQGLSSEYQSQPQQYQRPGAFQQRQPVNRFRG